MAEYCNFRACGQEPAKCFQPIIYREDAKLPYSFFVILTGSELILNSPDDVNLCEGASGFVRNVFKSPNQLNLFL